MPVAVGRRARFALTLRDGGVMIEGDGEVITASTRASGLHGRPGMTLRFTNLDEASKVVIAHLERVRFGAKISAPSDHLKPRPGPRPPEDAINAPVFGAAGNDPAQALAECVVVGDGVQLMQPGAPSGAMTPLDQRGMGSGSVRSVGAQPGSGPVQPIAGAGSGPVTSRPTPMPPSSGPMAKQVVTPQPPPTPAAPKFSIPTIPVAGPARPGSPTGPQRQTTLGQVVGPSPGPSKEMASVASPRESGPVQAAPDAIPTPSPSSAVTVAAGAATAPMPRPPIDSAVPSPQSDAAWLVTTTRGVAPPGFNDPPIVEPPKPPVIPKVSKRTMMGIAAIPREPARATDADFAAPAHDLGHVEESSPAASEKRPSGMESNTIEVDPTLMGPPPEPPTDDVGLPSPLHVASPLVTTPMPQLDAQAAALGPYVGVQAPAPGDAGPRALPGMGPGVPPLPKPKTGPASLARTEPQLEPIQSPPSGAFPPVTGAYPAGAFTTPPPGAMHAPMVPIPTPPPGAVPSGPLPGMAMGGPPMAPGPLPGSYVTPAPGLPAIPGDGRLPGYGSPLQGQRALTDGGSGFFVPESDEPVRPYRTDDLTAMVQAPRQKRILVIAISSAVVIALGIVAIAMLGGDDDENKVVTPPAGSGSGSTAVPDGSGSATAPAGSGSASVPEGSGSGSAGDGSGDGGGSAVAGSGSDSDSGSGSGTGSGVGEGSAAPVKSSPACKAKIVSTPSGADVMVAGKVRGKTPLELSNLKCAATQIRLTRPRYESYTKTIKPTAKGARLNVKLRRPQFTIKVSSTPSGATIALGSRKVGKTPTAIKVNGYEPVAITVTKDGYSPITERVTVKQNGTAIKLTLKR